MKQYSVVILGLLLGGGFAFGGIASYSGMVGSGQPQQQQDLNASLPSTNFVSGSFDMGVRGMRTAAVRNDVVFVNGFYDTEDQRQAMESWSNLPSKYNQRVYVQVKNESQPSEVLTRFGLNDFPSVVVIGGSQRGYSIVRNTTTSNVERSICSSFRQWGSVAGICRY